MDDWNERSDALRPVDLFEVDARDTEEPSRHWWIWLVYVVLFALSIPWYLPKGSTPQIWWGLPRWVIASLLAALGIALFTAFVVNRYWRDAEPSARATREESEEA